MNAKKICKIVFVLMFIFIHNAISALNDFNHDAGVYYGYPSLVNGASGNTDLATAAFSNLRFIVYPGDLYSSGHADFNESHTIASNLYSGPNETKMYGYVPIGGAPGENLSISEISNRIYQWYNNYTPFISGIFLDEFSYDWGATRDRQNKAVDWVHGLGLSVIANGWFPDHCLGLEDDPGFPNSLYNPSFEAVHISNGDLYCFENFVWSTTNGIDAAVYNNKDQWKNKTFQVMEYQEKIGIGVMPICVEEQNFNQFGTAGSLPHEHFSFWCVLACGYSNFQFSEFLFSSGNNDFYIYDDKITDNIGSEYAGNLQEVTNGIFYRYTDAGLIRLDWNNHTGSFIALGADNIPPEFDAYTVPASAENNVSIYAPVYLEVTDNRSVIKNTIDAKIDGVNAIVNGVFQSGFDAWGSEIIDDQIGGFYVTILKTDGFLFETSVDVWVRCSDYAGNYKTNSFSFNTGSTNFCVTYDGDFSDWSAKSKWDIDGRSEMTNDTPAEILRNYMYTAIDKTKSSNLNLGFVLGGIPAAGSVYAYQVYFDSDNSEQTGNTNDVYWQRFGAEYFLEFYVQNNTLNYSEGIKEWLGGLWQNTDVMPEFGINNQNIELGFSLSALGIGSSTNIRITFVAYSTNWIDADFNNEYPDGLISYHYEWKQCPDVTAPVFRTNEFDPQNDDLYISFANDIMIRAFDDGRIASNSINVQVNGTNAVINGVFQAGYNALNSAIQYAGPGNCSINIDRVLDFADMNIIDVKVWISDVFGNSKTNSYSFMTAGTNQCIIADGSLSDWPGFADGYKDSVNEYPYNPPTDIIRNLVYCGADARMRTNLYIAFIESASLNDGRAYEHLVYIDADQNQLTGNTADAYWVIPAMGADYRIDFYTENNLIAYTGPIDRWDGAAWVSTGVFPLTGVQNNIIEVIVPLDQINVPTGSINLTMASLDTNYNPDSNNDNNEPVIVYALDSGLCIDEEPPVFRTNNFFPLKGEAAVSFSSLIYLEIDDNAYVNTNLIQVKINGVNAVLNGQFQSGFNGPDSRIEDDGQGGCNVYIDKTVDFSPLQYITVNAIAGDYQDNYATNSYFFVTGDTNVCISIDGDLSDWGGYCSILFDGIGDNSGEPGADLQRIYCIDGSTVIYVTNLYFGFKFVQTQNTGKEYITVIYIDADNNALTGHSTDPWYTAEAMGAEYLVEIYTLNDTVVYSTLQTNDGTTWYEAGVYPNAEVSGNIIELGIPWTALSKITSSTVRFSFSSSTTQYSDFDYVYDATEPGYQYKILSKHCIDAIPPFIANTFPSDGFLGFSPDWDIKVWINDNAVVLSNSVIVRINGITALTNGGFSPAYTGSSLSKWANGYYCLINPVADLPKSTLITVSVEGSDFDLNLCDEEFSFTTAYTTYDPPPPPPPGITPVEQAGVYYAFVSPAEGGLDEIVNGTFDISLVVDIFNDYDFIVFGDTLESKAHGDFANLSNIAYQLVNNYDTIPMAYVPLSERGSWAAASNQAMEWLNNYNGGIKGIFWDEFGYDYPSVTRDYQNKCWDFCNQRGLIAIGNGWIVSDCFSDAVHVDNPLGKPTTAQPGNIYMNESFCVAGGAYQPVAAQINKAYDCMKYSKELGVKIYTGSTEASGDEWGDFDTVASINKQLYTYYSYLLFGFDYFQYSDINYSAGSAYLYFLPEYSGAAGFPASWPPYVGSLYISDVRTNSTSPLILERCTDYGRIWVNFTTYEGGFDQFTSYYVNANAVIGNNGYTPAQAQNEITPWLTIGHAVSNASAGDIIYVKGSTVDLYHESVVVGVSGGGFCFDYVQVIGYGDERVVLDGQNIFSDGFQFVNDSSKIIIENIDIENFTDSGIDIQSCNSTNISIVDCAIHHNGAYGINTAGRGCVIENNLIYSNGSGTPDAGIYIQSDCADDNLVHRNRIYGNDGYGLYCLGGDNNDLANNKIYDNSGYGIVIDGTADNNSVSLSHLYRNGTAGVYVSGSSGTVIQNNTSLKQNYGYYLASPCTIKNCISYSNSNTGYYSTSGGQNVTYSISYGDSSAVNVNINGGTFLSGTGCQTVDPDFSNPILDDYRLAYSSPGINAGSPTTDPAAIGGTSAAVRPQMGIPGAYELHTNTLTIYANTDVPSDGQICFAYPSGFNISGAKLSSKSFDGSAFVSVFMNELSVVRLGDGTDIPGGTSIQVVFSNIRNTALTGGQTVQFYIKNSYGQIIMGPQQSCDLYILEPFSIVARSPVPGTVDVPFDANVNIFFSKSVNTNTLNTNTVYITDDIGIKIDGNFVMISSNTVRFIPDPSLPPNSLVYVTVTTNLAAKTTQTLISNETWLFYTGPGNTTPHTYNDITVDGGLGDWVDANFITYDQSLGEHAGEDTGDTCTMDTTDFYVTWDSVNLYLGIVKNNSDNINGRWRDLFLIDITRDSQGASVFDGGLVEYVNRNFNSPRKPEFVISMRYNWSGSHWNETGLYRYNGTGLVADAFTTVTYQGTASMSLELSIPLADLTNSEVGVTDLPNRIALMHFVAYDPGCGDVSSKELPQDYCPNDGSWVNVDVDNDGNDIPDRLSPMQLTYRDPGPGETHFISDNITLGFDKVVNSSSVGTNTVWVEYSGVKLPGTFVAIGTNIIFDPAANLVGGETYTIYVTTGVLSVNGEGLTNIQNWNFSAYPGIETPHLYNTITLGGNREEWIWDNWVVSDSSLGERLSQSAPEGCDDASDGFWLTWDETDLYFMIDKENSGTIVNDVFSDWIYIDITYDNQGGPSFSHDAPYLVDSYLSPYMPEFILGFYYNWSGNPWTLVQTYKWNGASWDQDLFTLTTGRSNSAFLEIKMSLSDLTNNAVGVSDLPNHLNVKHATVYASDCGGSWAQRPPDDCEPDDCSWVEIDIDNNSDNVPDKLRALEVISSDPVERQTDVPLMTAVSLYFNEPVLSETVTNGQVLLQDSEWNTVNGSFTVSGSNVQFFPSASLKPNEFYTMTITTGVTSIYGKGIASDQMVHFYTTSGFETVHTRHSVDILTAPSLADFDPLNNIAYDNSLGENIAHDAIEDLASDPASTNLWITWDLNNLYFAIQKRSAGASTLNWHDYIAFDITRDDQGASLMTDNDSGTVSFFNNRKPEYYFQLDHDRTGAAWSAFDESRGYKWNGVAWAQVGSVTSDWNIDSVADSSVVKGWIDLSLLTNENGDLPNRIAIITWTANDVGGAIVDFCPEFITGQNVYATNWLTFDIDNNGDEVPDGGTPALHLVTIEPANSSSGNSTNSILSIVFDDTIDPLTIDNTSCILQDSDFNLVSGTYTVVGTNAVFTPDNGLKPNEYYTISLTTAIETPLNVPLDQNYNFDFYTGPGLLTSHFYRTPVLDGNPVDWYDANNITYDKSYGEKIVIDASEDGGANSSTNLWFTWDEDLLYFCIQKNNNGNSSSDWFDYLAFDITRDDYGATNYNDADTGIVSFDNNRRPELILKMAHNDTGNNWVQASSVLSGYSAGAWSSLGISGADYQIQGDGYNNSSVLEGWVRLGILQNQIPNRVSVLAWSASGGAVVDYCLEITTGQTASNRAWMTLDPDNNSDGIADGTSMLLTLKRADPTNREQEIISSSDIILTFDDVLNEATVNGTSVYLQDSEWNTVSCSLNLTDGTNIVINPDVNLLPNEFYTVTITMFLQGQLGQTLSAVTESHFYTEAGTLTPHNYNTIVLNAELSDWEETNPVTYDSSLTEQFVSDSGIEDGIGASATTNLKITWDLNQLYFCLEKYNSGASSADWYDFLAFDITRDDQGADTFTNSTFCGTVHFSRNRKPEYIMILDHFELAYRWDQAGSETQLWKYNSITGKWDKTGVMGNAFNIQGEGFNTSRLVEGWIRHISLLNESGGIPNRIAVLDFAANRFAGTVYDFCPEFSAPGNSHTWATNKYWETYDLDNNGDNIPDAVASGVSVRIYKKVNSVSLNGIASSYVPGATVELELSYSNVDMSDAEGVILIDKISEFTVYTSWGGGTAVGWSVEWSTNLDPNQIWLSADYTPTQPEREKIRWIRWKKSSVGTAEDGMTLQYKVIIK